MPPATNCRVAAGAGSSLLSTAATQEFVEQAHRDHFARTRKSRRPTRCPTNDRSGRDREPFQLIKKAYGSGKLVERGIAETVCAPQRAGFKTWPGLV